jgi:hypothetical protein
MKILLLVCVITVFTTTGCFFPGPGWHHDRGWHDRGEINVAPAVVEASVPAPDEAPPAVKAPSPEIVVAAP